MKRALCKSHPSKGVWGHAPQKMFEQIAALVWQLADYPTLVFKITAF